MVIRAVDAIDQYIADCRHRNLSPKTFAGYSWALRLLSDHSHGLPSSPGELLRILDVPGVADETRHHLWRAVRTFYKWLERTRRVDNLMDALPAPKTRRRLPRALDDKEVQALLDAAGCLRDLTLIALMLDTGARIGEVAGMTRSAVSPEGIDIYGKTGGRFVPFSTDIYEMVAAIGEGEVIWVGIRGRPLTTNGLGQVVRRTMIRSGLKPPKMGPHTLRHTFARRFLRLGGNLASLQRLLGHTDIQSTMVYAWMSDRDLMDQHRRFSPLRGFAVGKPARIGMF